MTTGVRVIRVGWTVVLLLVIAATVFTAVQGGPWWVLATCTLMGLVRLPTPLAFLVVGVLIYLTWGTWWLLCPLVVLGIGFRVRQNPVKAGNYGIRLLARSRLTEDVNTLLQAVSMLRVAVANTAPADPYHTLFSANLGAALTLSFRGSGERAFAEEAIQVCRNAVATVTPDHPYRSMCLTSLGGALVAVYHQTGETAVLRDAVQVHRDVVAAADGEIERHTVLANLSGALLLLFQQCGDQAVLEEAVSVSRDALAACPVDSDSRLLLEANLAGALLGLYHLHGDLWILEEAVQRCRDSVSASSPDQPGHLAALFGLGSVLLTLFGRTGKTAVLEEAIQSLRDVLAECRPDASDRHSYLANLGGALWASYDRCGRLDRADEAIQLLRDAVAAAPPGHQRASRLANLSGALVTRFRVDGEPEVLAEAIRKSRDALAATPADHHDDRAGCLRGLGTALELSFESTGDPATLAEARYVFAAAAEVVAQPGLHRMYDLQKAADLDLLAGDHDHAAAMAELAVEQVPQVASRQLGRDDREHRVVSLAGLASTAATAAIATEHPNRAVELLEQTRGILLAGTFDTRSDLTELRNQAPALARELHDLQMALEDADHAPNIFGIETPGTPDHRQLAERRIQLSEQWTELLTRIRRRPALKGFLRPPSINQLRRQATEGPIVYVIAHNRRGHGLLVTDDPEQPVRVVDLPELTQKTATEQADLLRLAQRTATDPDLPASERTAAQQRILQILGWLWDTVTEPVLRQLSLTTAPPDGNPSPRMWWCPVGICAFLPLHAAGHHTPPYTETVMDRVISSYTPTIRALSHARIPRPTATTAPSVMIVAVPNAPDSPPLPGVTREADLLHALIPAATTLRSPRYDNVAGALPNHRIAHFACHGLTVSDVPADSRLLLDDHLEHPFTVNTIARMRLDQGELAYLSACSTTDTTRSHADEAVHITAAFHLAGYRNVIGTLWPVNDHAATTIATDFYTHLTHNGTTAPDPTTAAATLHEIIRRRRTQYPSLPTQWAAYLHTGL